MIQAVCLLGAAANLHEAIGAPMRAIDVPRYQQIIAATHAQLSDAGFALAWAEGQALALEAAVQIALAFVG